MAQVQGNVFLSSQCFKFGDLLAVWKLKKCKISAQYLQIYAYKAKNTGT